jgi:hypothetical protein
MELLIVGIVGAVLAMTIWLLTDPVRNTPQPTEQAQRPEQTQRLGQVAEYLGKDADVMPIPYRDRAALTTTSTSATDLFPMALVHPISPMTQFFVVARFSKTGPDSISLGLKLNNTYVGPTTITTDQKSGTITWFIGTDHMSLRWRSRGESHQADIPDERPVAPISNIAFNARTDSGTLIIDEAWIYTFPIKDRPAGPIQWDFSGIFTMGTYRGDPTLRFSAFMIHGKNVTDHPVMRVSGYIRSNLTNEHLPIYITITANGNRVPPEKIAGIPPSASVEISAHFGSEDDPKQMLDELGLFQRFGDITFVIELDGRKEEHRFSRDDIERMVVRGKRQIYGVPKPSIQTKHD